MSGKTWTWTVTPSGAAAFLPVLDGSITVDATRNPQVSASVTVPFTSWTAARRFDPFTRSEVVVEIRTTTHIGGTLGTFGQGTTPGTLSTLTWSAKASKPSILAGNATARVETRRLRMYVTDVTVDEFADTLDVSLVNADYLLTEMVNFGPSWMPRPGPGSGTQWTLDDTWGEFFRVYGLPLWLSGTLADPSTGYAWRSTLEPWATGDDAWSWLNGIRTEVPGWRYVLNTQTGQISFLEGFGDVTAPSSIRNGATSISVQRSVETSIEGVNQYADGIAIRWTDRTGQNRPDSWEFANAHGDWRLMRRPLTEQRDMPSSGTAPALAEARVARSQKFRRLVTVTQPIARVTGPFRDLFDHPLRTSVQSITYNYVPGDVTTTYLESDD